MIDHFNNKVTISVLYRLAFGIMILILNTMKFEFMYKNQAMEGLILWFVPNSWKKSKLFLNLDAFPKVKRELTDSTSTGGFVTLALLFCGLLLIGSEVIQWQKVVMDYAFFVDQITGHQLEINIDISIICILIK
jgi:hypothetical protein